MNFICKYCNDPFERTDRYARAKEKSGRKITYCSLRCNGLDHITSVALECANCHEVFHRQPGQNKGKNSFCSKRCAAIYNNKHRKTGIRRSKAEQYLSELLTNDSIEHVCNARDVIPSGLEIDVWIPSMNLAIELNGPVHYQPIYGEDKFSKIQKNDQLKALEIQELGIRLVIIDVCQTQFKLTKEVLDKFYEEASGNWNRTNS